MRRAILFWAGLSLLCGTLARAEATRFFALGDLPYKTAEEAQLSALFDQAVAGGSPFLVHVGDIKSGGSPCTDAQLSRIAEIFRGQPVPVVYTPGDNEWTDCHRLSAGAKDPRERLARLRELFFADPEVLRLDRLGARVAAGGDGPAYPEQVAFMHSGILFVTLHVVGSNNGHRSGDAAAIAEFTAREAATRRWLAQALEQAKAQEALAMVLFFQANPQFELARPARGFVGLRESLIELLDRYPGPVLVIHGDTHNFQHNQPLRDARTGRTIERFVRVEVPGSPRIGGVWISIDASAETPFRVELVDLLARDPITP